MARSRCSFSILIRYGSFEGCCDQRIPGLLDNDIGMIVADELSFREWKCFEHLTRQRVGSHLSWPKRASVWSSSGSRQREEFRTLCTSWSAWITHGLEMVKSESRDRSDV